MSNRVHLIAFLAIGLLLSPVAPAQSQPLVSVNRTTVAEGSTLTLRVRSHNPDATLNARPLSRDFRVVSRRTNTNNPALDAPGDTYQEWALELEPRRTGTLTVPPLQVDGEQTRALTIRVLPVSPEQQQFRDRLIEADLNIAQTDLYVDETTEVTLTLYYNVTIDGEFRDIQPDASRWEPVGGAQTGTTEWQDGRRVNYHRFQYLFTPLESGNQRLPAIEFDGTYRTHGFSGPRPVTVETEPVPLDVRPVPADYPAGAVWLPARQVTLNETWSTPPDQLDAGESTERRLQLHAVGPGADRLPSLSPPQPDPEHLEQFTDSPQAQESATPDGYQSSVSRSVLYRNRSRSAVDATIPAIEVHWWNTRTDQLEVARLPERTLPLGAGNASDGNASGDTGSVANEHTVFGDRFLRWGLAAAALLLLVAGALLRRRYQRLRAADRAGKPAGELPPPAEDQSDWRSAVRPLVARNDWQALEQSLADRWQTLGWPDADALERALQAPGLATALNTTRARLYARPDQRPSDDRVRELWFAVLDQRR